MFLKLVHPAGHRSFIHLFIYSLTHRLTHLLTHSPTNCRGLTEEDFEKVAHFFDRAVTITENINAKTGPKVSFLSLLCIFISLKQHSLS